MSNTLKSYNILMNNENVLDADNPEKDWSPKDIAAKKILETVQTYDEFATEMAKVGAGEGTFSNLAKRVSEGYFLPMAIEMTKPSTLRQKTAKKITGLHILPDASVEALGRQAMNRAHKEAREATKDMQARLEEPENIAALGPLYVSAKKELQLRTILAQMEGDQFLAGNPELYRLYTQKNPAVLEILFRVAREAVLRHGMKFSEIW